MCKSQELLNKKMLNLQNAIIRQCVDQTKLKNEINDFSQRSDFYENLYNKTKNEFYELEVQYKAVVEENKLLKKNDINNLGMRHILKIILLRLKNNINRRQDEFN